MNGEIEMKKIISLLLALTMCFSLSITAFADETEITGVIGIPQTADVTIEYYVPSEYTIYIPERFIIDELYPQKLYASKMDILDTEQVNVYVNYPDVNEYGVPVMYLTNANTGDKIEFTFNSGHENNCLTCFLKDMEESDCGIYGTLQRQYLHAGIYTGTIQFTIRIVDKGYF